MSAPNACNQADAVCLSLTGEVPAPAIDYIAVSAKPFAGSVEIVLCVLGFVAILLALRWVVLWEKRQ